ncbi:MAG: glycosyl transferase, partial [Beijerinckiaceae bacterium]
PAYFRLGVHFACVGALLFPTMPDQRLRAGIPVIAEGFLVLLAGVWFVNLTNFMDGIDWLTVACVVPATLFLGLLGFAGGLDSVAAVLALGLCGGLIGFAPANRPVARLFLGDVGSLPIGLLLAYLLYRLAISGAWIAALLLPLYSVCDATFTLFRRLIRRERVWEAHRSHIYQRATDNGFSVKSVCLHLFCLNLVLCGLASLSIWSSRLDVGIVTLTAGLGLTVILMRHFSRPRGSLGG